MTNRDKNRFLFRGIGFALSLAIVYLLLFAFLARATHEVEINVDVAEPSALRVFWTVPGSPFVKERSRAMHIGPGRDRYRLVIWSSAKPFHLQFQAAEYLNKIGFRELSVHRVGRESTGLQSDDIDSRMFVVGDGQKTRVQNGAVHFAKADDWFALRIDSVGPGDSGAWKIPLLFVLAGYVGLLALARFVQGGSERRHWLNYAVLVAALVGLTRWGTNVIPYAGLLALYAAAVSLVILRVVMFVYEWLRGKKGPAKWKASGIRILLPMLFFGFIGWLGIAQLPLLAGFDLSSLVRLTGFTQARSQFVGFYDQNFSHRPELLGVNAEVKFSVLKSSPLQKMMVGTDGFVFEGRGERRVEKADVRSFNNFADYLGRLPLTDAQLQQWGRVLQARYDYLAELGVAYVFAIAPTKGMVYPEKMPRRFRPGPGVKTRYDQLVTYIKENTTVPVADLREAMLKAKVAHDNPHLYYRIDFHWNFLGAFFAYEELVKVVNQHYPQLKLTPLKLSDFSIDVDNDWIDRTYLTTLGLRAYAHHADQYVKLRPHDRSRFPAKWLLDTGVQDAPMPTRVLKTRKGPVSVKVLPNPAGEPNKMVIFGDSFIYKTMFYFSTHAERLVFKRTVFEFPDEIVEAEKPDLLVQEILNMYIIGDPPQR